MDISIESMEFGHFDLVLNLLSKCTDDYLFIFDLQLDEYSVSENAVNRFQLEEYQFKNATARLAEVCHPEDYAQLVENIQGIRSGNVKEHNLEYRWLSKDGDTVWINCHGQLVHGEDHSVRYIVGRITELGRKNIMDNVTGLYREVKLCSDLTQIQKLDEEINYLLLIGIDNFREINEKHGKSFGNQVLVALCRCIHNCVGDGGIVYRMSGDEMLVLTKGKADGREDPAREMFQKIRRKLDADISESGYQHFLTISGGSAYYSRDMDNILKLIEQAEFSLHQAKVNGKNTYVKYDAAQHEVFLARLDMQERLRQAVENDFYGFELYYQPIIHVEKRKILGAEALLRWRDDVLGMVSPAVFIPLLEDSGLIIPVGRWIIKTAMTKCLEWQKQDADFRININLSFIQIRKSNLIKDIDECMRELNFSSKNVLFEITESGELEEGGATEGILHNFQRRNLNLAIDDFGTGYSNLRYIKEMMFDLVKIDQAFIRNIKDNQYDYLVVKQFTELAHSLNLKVCYEGVETYDVLQCVLELDPDYIQGFYFAKPVSVSEFEAKYLCKLIDF